MHLSLLSASTVRIKCETVLVVSVVCTGGYVVLCTQTYRAVWLNSSKHSSFSLKICLFWFRRQPTPPHQFQEQETTSTFLNEQLCWFAAVIISMLEVHILKITQESGDDAEAFLWILETLKKK